MTDLYVATTGSDTAPGTAAQPFATLGKALAVANGSAAANIYVQAGVYAKPRDELARAYPVTVTGWDGAIPEVQGLNLLGSSRLTFDRVKFTGKCDVLDDPFHTRGAQSIVIENSELTMGPARGLPAPPEATPLGLRSGSSLTVRACWLHDNYTAFGAANATVKSTLTFEDNLIEWNTADGMQFGALKDTVIRGNTIRHMRDPDAFIHNDCIQFIGNCNDVLIENNRLYDVLSGQIILIQPSVGPNFNVTVRNNLMYRNNGVAVQAQSCMGFQAINNTIWDNDVAGMWLRKYGTEPPGTDAVLVNNILSSLSVIEGAAVATAAGNVAAQAPAMAGVTVMSDPGFLDPSNPDYDARNYHLRADAPARGVGAPALAPVTDQEGQARQGTDPGALSAQQTTFARYGVRALMEGTAA